MRPEVVPYLFLPEGTRLIIMINRTGYKDVWTDETD
ncbi:immunity protein Imm33 domain-containing protein [Pectobacterium odoriferum]